MSEYPLISRGIGKLTPDLWRRLMRSLEWYESVSPTVQTKRPDRSGAGAQSAAKEVLLLQLTISFPFVFNPARWKYGWAEAEVFDGDFRTKQDGLASSTPGYSFALNAEERLNTLAGGGTTSYGIPNNPGIGQSVVPLRIPQNSIVVATVQVDADAGVLIPVFAGSNALLIGCGP